MQKLGCGTIGETVIAVRNTMSRQLSPWIRKMISRLFLVEATERKVGQSNAEPARCWPSNRHLNIDLLYRYLPE